MYNGSMAKVSQGKPGGVASKQHLYQLTAAHAKEAIQTLLLAMRNGENYATKVGAAKTILAKCIPDLKATELSGVDGKELVIRLLDYGKQLPGHNLPAETETSIRDES
jgi:hypothetical protein